MVQKEGGEMIIFLTVWVFLLSGYVYLVTSHIIKLQKMVLSNGQSQLNINGSFSKSIQNLTESIEIIRKRWEKM